MNIHRDGDEQREHENETQGQSIVGYAVGKYGETPLSKEREAEDAVHGIRRWWEAQRVSTDEAWA